MERVKELSLDDEPLFEFKNSDGSAICRKSLPSFKIIAFNGIVAGKQTRVVVVHDKGPKEIFQALKASGIDLIYCIQKDLLGNCLPDESITQVTPPTDGPLIGVFYGTQASEGPSPRQVVTEFYKRNNIEAMMIHEKEPKEVLEALRASRIELALCIHKDCLETLVDESKAIEWVQTYVNDYPTVDLKYIIVGNGVNPMDHEAKYVLPAIKNISKAILEIAPQNQPIVTVVMDFNMLNDAKLPSESSFTHSAFNYLVDILKLLSTQGNPLFVNFHLFNCVNYPLGNYTIEFSNFTESHPIIMDEGYGYKNLFDFLLDSIYVALEKADAKGLQVIVSETGWPTQGHEAATRSNASLYVTNLIRHVRGGTPRYPNLQGTKTYLYAILDENQHPGPLHNKHYGIFTSEGKKKYSIRVN